MRKLIGIVAIILLSSCGNGKGTNSPSQMPAKDTATRLAEKTPEIFQIPKSVDAIKEAYSTIINELNNNQLDSNSIKYDCKGERSGTITYCSKNGILRIVKHKYTEYDHFEATDEYFVNDKTLFFAHLNTLLWSFDSTGGKDGATKDDITEQRIYLVDDLPIQCLEKKFTIRSQATDNPKPENVPNKIVDCETNRSLQKDFQKLSNFQNSADKGCLGK